MEVGLLIALGAMLGKLLAESGGADRVVDTLVSRSGPRLVPSAIALVAVIIGLPMFFEIGLVLMLPIIVLVTKKSELPLMRVAIPALAGLSVLPGLIPPHPGPLIAIAAVHADLGITLAFGIVVALPTVAICGPLFSVLAARWVPVGAPDSAGGVDTTSEHARSDDVTRPPSFAVTLATILFPVVLMLLKALADIIWDNATNPPKIRIVLDFIGEPLVALFLAVSLAMFTFGYAVGFDAKAIADRIAASLGPIAGIILIVGAGGGFKQTLIGAGVGDSIAKAVNDAGVSVVVVGYLLAVAIRLAYRLGHRGHDHRRGHRGATRARPAVEPSGTARARGGVRLAVLVPRQRRELWLVNQSFKLTVGQTFKTWSVMETLVSVVGFTFVSLLRLVT